MDVHPKGTMGRKSKLLIAIALIVLLLTCYFCWEILLQERVILDILRMGPAQGSTRQIEPGNDHLEEVVENWFEKKQQISVHTGDVNSTSWESSENLVSHRKYYRTNSTARKT